VGVKLRSEYHDLTGQQHLKPTLTGSHTNKSQVAQGYGTHLNRSRITKHTQSWNETNKFRKEVFSADKNLNFEA
jgi:hypothetical protein